MRTLRQLGRKMIQRMRRMFELGVSVSSLIASLPFVQG